MYGWYWRALPGNVVIKTLETLVLLAVTLVLLWLYGFPWIEHHLPIGSVTV